MAMSDWSAIPSVDRILQAQEMQHCIAEYGRTLTLSEIRFELDEVRKILSNGGVIPELSKLYEQINERLEKFDSYSIKTVINATGVILHTNLGRAPLSLAATQAVLNGLKAYSAVEYDIESGSRSHRTDHVETLIGRLLGVESAFVVNNNASAVLLVLSSLANKRRVIISRGQLVEIGGGFRVPDVMRQSGAKLIEIGTTNRVYIADYQKALQEPTGLVLHVHSSNFRVIGFASEPALADMVEAAHKAGVPVVNDIGSGALLDTGQYGLAHEPTVQESLAAGVDVVCFSGDKLFGGPQAGIIVGKRKYLDVIKRHPLARAIRTDKTLLLGLEATLLHYLKDEAVEEIPVWRMISAPLAEMRKRANRFQQVLGEGEVIESRSTIGGGSLPEETLPTWVLSIRVPKPDSFTKRLRTENPAVIARIQDDKVIFDPRTVFPDQDSILLESIQKQLKEHR